jgi:ABC-type spermidine/putrescine transport system permease subunit I
MVAETPQCLTGITEPARRKEEPGMNKTAIALMLPSLVVVVLLCLVPLSLVIVWSFWSWDPATYWIKPDLTIAAYQKILQAGRWQVLVDTVLKAGLTGVICLFIGFPAAYVIHFCAKGRMALLLMALFTIPFFTSYLIRAFSWRLVLGRHGLVNDTLLELGWIDAPLEWLLFTNFAVIIGMTASYLPFVIFPLLLAMRKVEPSVLHASMDLGANFRQTMFNVLLPLTKPGLFAGFLFVFVISLGSSTEVQMLGGAGASTISIMINDVMRVVNFPLAFAISSVVLLFLVFVLYVGDRFLGFSKLFEDFTW